MAMRLSEGHLPWNEIKPKVEKLRDLGVRQFLHLWKSIQGRKGEPTTWGDEVEYKILAFDDEKKEVYLSVKQDEIISASNDPSSKYQWQREYAGYMVESTPVTPYDLTIFELLRVETSMKKRRCDLARKLARNEAPFTISMFPRLGASGQYSTPKFKLQPTNASSKLVPDELVSSNPKYHAVEINLRARRGGLAAINIPILEDVNTKTPWKDPTWDPDVSSSICVDNSIHLDSLIYGAGCCGVQCTFQAIDLQEACNLHDQFVPIGPIMMVLTASTPIYKGYLADTDLRWDHFAAAVDDRRPSEDRSVPERWSLSPAYLCEHSPFAYSGRSLRGADLLVRKEIKKRLIKEGLDAPMAHYFATIFGRDPILVTDKDMDELSQKQSDKISTRLFEGLYATVWTHVRLKLPPAEDPAAAWRVEFRMMEVQPTDFENAAVVVFMALLRGAIHRFELDLCVPMGFVEANSHRAHGRDAVLNERFWFRKCFSRSRAETWVDEVGAELFTIDEIMNGTTSEAPSCCPHSRFGIPMGGLIAVVEAYVDETLRPPQNEDGETKAGYEGMDEALERVRTYIQFIRQRASGEIPTPARWMRDFVRAHDGYKLDSEVPMGVCYDLLKAMEQRNGGDPRSWDIDPTPIIPDSAKK